MEPKMREEWWKNHKGYQKIISIKQKLVLVNVKEKLGEPLWRQESQRYKGLGDEQENNPGKQFGDSEDPKRRETHRQQMGLLSRS